MEFSNRIRLNVGRLVNRVIKGKVVLKLAAPLGFDIGNPRIQGRDGSQYTTQEPSYTAFKQYLVEIPYLKQFYWVLP